VQPPKTNYGVLIVRKITAKCMGDLLAKVYEKNGWVRTVGESRTKRVLEYYDLAMDQKKNVFTAIEKGS